MRIRLFNTFSDLFRFGEYELHDKVSLKKERARGWVEGLKLVLRGPSIRSRFAVRSTNHPALASLAHPPLKGGEWGWFRIHSFPSVFNEGGAKRRSG